MFRFNKLEQIHIEITNNCQASCPMCGRNHHGGMSNPKIKINEWTIDDFISIINKEVLEQIKQIYFCGNFGDPLLNDDLLKMCQYIKNNSNVGIRIHTNGSIRNNEWWNKLYECLPKDHAVIFALDGLEDTHSRYRIGTNFQKILNNARHFINCGGKAEWAYLVFQHNQHQVEQARIQASEIGFNKFTVKHSARFVVDKDFEVYDSSGNVIDTLNPPSNSVIKFVDKKILQDYQNIINETEIDCYVLKTKEVYIDAYKNLMPCCFLSSAPYNYTPIDSPIVDIRQKILEQYYDVVKSLKVINTLEKSIKHIVDSIEYQTIWNEYWTTKKLLTCARTCGKNNLSKPTDQFIENKNLK